MQKIQRFSVFFWLYFPATVFFPERLFRDSKTTEGLCQSSSSVKLKAVDVRENCISWDQIGHSSTKKVSNPNSKCMKSCKWKSILHFRKVKEMYLLRLRTKSLTDMIKRSATTWNFNKCFEWKICLLEKVLKTHFNIVKL